MPVSVDIRPLIVRNFDIMALATLGARLIDSEESKRDALASAEMSFGGGQATDEFIDQVRELLDLTLTGRLFDREILMWVLTSALGQRNAGQAVDLIANWRFGGRIRRNRPPHPKAPEAWLVIESEDAYIDVLMQPLAVVSNCLRLMYDTWFPVVEHKITAHPQFSVSDSVLAQLELFVMASLGIPHEPVTRADAHARYFVTTQASVHVDDSAASEMPVNPGFVTCSNTASLPWQDNIEFIINESCRPLVAPPQFEAGPLQIDPYYGQVYHSSVLANNSGVYAPGPSGDRVSALVQTALPAPNYGWLSVPFRQVPRYRVETLAEFSQVLHGIRAEYAMARPREDDWLPLLLRGQNKEYLLPRPAGARTILYNVESALEPALLASATRRTTSLETVAGFAAAVQATLMAPLNPVADDETTLWTLVDGDALKSALGQHYGLATDALDWTTDPLVALWFALTRIEGNPGGNPMVSTPVARDAEAVFYCLWPERGHARNVAIAEHPGSRPSRQRGWITTASWGLRPNRVATYLFAAIYLPGSLRDELTKGLPAADYLFPSAPEDKLIETLRRLCARVPHSDITYQLKKDLYEL